MSKKVLVYFIFLAFIKVANSQTTAVTSEGDTIYVYDNGTWSYELLNDVPELQNEFDYLNEKIKIDTILTTFSSPSSADKTITNSRDQFTIKYDNSSWKRVPAATLNEEAEFAFEARDSDIWCVVISEETPISPESLFKIAKNTMEETSGTTTEIIKAEYRTVNDTPVIRGALQANYGGIEFIFDSYYFSDDNGSVQFTTWTSSKVWEKNKELIHNLLNGFRVTE